MPFLRFFILASTLLSLAEGANAANDGLRTLVVRERATAELMDNSFAFRVMKLRGYSIDIMLRGERRKLNLGDHFGPADGSCMIKFEEISPETRIARFKTDCH